MRVVRVLVATLLTVAASVFVAVPAHALTGTVSVGANGEVYFTGGGALRVDYLTATTVTLLADNYAPSVLVPGPGCAKTSVQPDVIECTLGNGTPTVHLAFGSGFDVCVCIAPVRYTIDFGPGNDLLFDFVTPYVATVAGGDGDDYLMSGATDDTIDGGKGYDVLTYKNKKQSVWASLTSGQGGVAGTEVDTLKNIEGLAGGSGDDVLFGDGGPNQLEGNGGHDSVYGMGGNDLLMADRGSAPDDDTLYGGDGNDTVSYAFHDEAVSASLNGLRDDGSAGTGEKDLIGSDVENLGGSRYSDIVVGNDGPNRLYGSDPVNYMFVFGEHYSIAGSGNDWLFGGGGNDILYGYEGHDSLYGGGGDDRLVGGPDADDMYGDDGHDYVSYETHEVAVTASLDGKKNDGAAGENDYIAPDVENLNGSIAGDTLLGNDGSNVIVGDPPRSIGGGGDIIVTYGGTDKVYAGAGNDVVSLGNGNDTGYGSWGDDWLMGDAGVDLLDGGQGTDTCDTGADGGTTVDCSP